MSELQQSEVKTVQLLDQLSKLVPDEVESFVHYFRLPQFDHIIHLSTNEDRWVTFGYFKELIFERGWDIDISMSHKRSVAAKVNDCKSVGCFDPLDALLTAYLGSLEGENQ